jgi:general secretion pathway protein A
MYKGFFGLTRNPFDLSPDPSFMCPSGKSEEALASIYHAVLQRKGFVVLTGEVGTGKTLVVRYLCDLWKNRRIAFANIIGPSLSVSDFLSYLVFDLGIEAVEPTKGNLLRALYGFLLSQNEKGLPTVLVIDEAHQVPPAVLEEIRLLTNFETAREKLLQVLLVGQPELDQKLDSFELRQLKQRVAIRCQLEPLGEEETRLYIERRLTLAGLNSQATQIFPAETVGAIYRYSLGVPRLVNSICEQAMIAAYARQIPVVPVEIVAEVARYFRLQPRADLGPTQKLSSLSEHWASLVPKISWQPELVVNAPAAIAPDSEPLPSHVEAPTAKPAQATLTSKPQPSFTSIGSQEDVQRLASATTVTNVSTIESCAPGPATDGLKSGRAAHAEKSSKHPQNGRRVAAGVALLSVLAGGRIFLFRSGAIGNAAGKPVPELTASRTERNLGENAAPQLAESTEQLNPSRRRPASESAATKADVLKVTHPSEKEQSRPRPAVERAVPNVRADLFESLNARPTSHHAEIHEIQTAPDPVAVPSSDDSILPAIVLTSDLAAPPVPDSTTNRPRQLGGQIHPARLLSSVIPTFPAAAPQAHMQGDVVVQTVIDRSGKVTDMQVVSGPLLLRQAALAALRQWRYEAETLNGQPISVQMLVTIRFRP